MPIQLASPTLDFTTLDGQYRMRLLTGSLVKADSGWHDTVDAALAALGADAFAWLTRVADRHANPLPDPDA